MLTAKIEVTVTALGLLAWEAWRAHEGHPVAARVRKIVAVGLAVIAAAVYVDFGRVHGMNALHTWDTFHYFVGSKYFEELSYTRLYACTAVAEAASNRTRLWWRIRDLETGLIVPALPVVADPDECKRHFSEKRWTEFRHDAAYFWERVSIPAWSRITTDHGFNATPVWMAAGTVLSNLAPASDTFLSLLAALDTLLLLAATTALAWAFGARVVTLAVVFYAVNEPSSFGWVGGAFLRHDWLACVVLAVCLMRRGYAGWAGACLAYASLLRLFPILLFAGPVAQAAVELRRSGSLSRELKSFFLGSAAGGALLVAASVAVVGVDAYPKFVDHIRRFVDTPLTNHVGLKTALSYRHATRVEETSKLPVDDPWPIWKQHRRDQYRPGVPVHMAILAFFAIEFFRTVKLGTSWQAIALGVAWIPLVAQLTCYYYSFPVAAAALTADRRGHAVDVLLLGMALCGQAAGAAFSWWDERYAATSVAVAVWAFFLPMAWREREPR